MQRDVCVVGVKAFDYVSVLQNVLAGARRKAGELIIGSGVIDKRIVQSLTQFMGQGIYVSKNAWVAENAGRVFPELCWAAAMLPVRQSPSSETDKSNLRIAGPLLKESSDGGLQGYLAQLL